jgi:hypothetical protein
MRALVSVVPLLLCFACQPPPDIADPAPACDPKVMKCVVSSPSGMGASGNEGGADSGGGEEVANFSGSVIAFDDDYFDRGAAFTGMAAVSATGQSGARVKGNYDGASFQLVNVLKDASNWFLVEPELASGMLPTLMPLDTRTTKADQLSLGVANSTVVDSIFMLSGASTERSVERAQVVLTLVDTKLRSVPGVTGTLTSEMTAYRTAGSWVGVTTQNVTDSSGMIFFGNVPAGSALSTATISLTGAVTARVTVTIKAGVLTAVNAIVSP